MEAKDKIIKVKVILQREKPFFAFLLSHLKFIEKKEVGTMGVNYKGEVFYNKEFVENINFDELKGVLTHELLHLIKEDMIRCKEYNANSKLFNIASDLVINDILIDNNFTLPKGVLIPEQHSFEFRDLNIKIERINEKSTEQIYDELKKQIKNNIKQQIKQAIQEGKDIDIDIDINEDDLSIDLDDLDLDEKEKKELEKKINEKLKDLAKKQFDEHKTINEDLKNKTEKEKEEIKRKAEEIAKEFKKKVVEAGQLAKMRGELPEGIERFIDELLKPQVSWKYILNKYITNELISDFSFRKPSKRSLAVKTYLPSSIKENINVVVAIDLSGSIGQEELREFLSEVVGIARTYSNIKMRIITHDVDVYDDYEVRNGNVKKILSLKLHGGGGTSHKKVFDYISKIRDTNGAIFFTDGYSDLNEINFNRYRFDKIFVLSKSGTDEQLKNKRCKIIKIK